LVKRGGGDGPGNALVLGVSVEVDLVKSGGQELNITTTAVNVLRVLDGVLEDEGLSLVREVSELLGDGVETIVLRGAETWKANV